MDQSADVRLAEVRKLLLEVEKRNCFAGSGRLCDCLRGLDWYPKLLDLLGIAHTSSRQTTRCADVDKE